jgi:hypothetical protein
MNKNNILAFVAGVVITLLAQHFVGSSSPPSSLADPPSAPAPQTTATEEISPPAATPSHCETSPPPEPKIIYKCLNDEPIGPLPAPAFRNSMPEILESNREGEVLVQWLPVEHAKMYQVRMYDKNGRMVKFWKTSKTTLYLKQLPFDDGLDFTPYQVTLVAMTQSDVEGSESEKKDLHVRKLKNIVAPNIEAITVED